MTDKSLEVPAEDIVCGLAEEAGWFVRKLTWVGRRGAPDRMFVKPGRFVLIEFKRPKKDATVQQSKEHVRLRQAGFEVHTCPTIEEALTVLKIL